MQNPIHSFLLTKKSVHTFGNRLYFNLPRKDYFQGIWQIAVKNVCFCLHENINKFVAISSNFVTDTKFNNENDTEPFNTQLAILALNGQKDTKKCIEYEKTWFLINSITDTLILTLKDVELDNDLNVDADFYITILLRRLI